MSRNRPRIKSNKLRQEVKFLSQSLEINSYAAAEGPKQKTWTIHDLKSLSPLTYNQKTMFDLFYDTNLVCYGSAGTGKSYCALYLAFKDILVEKQYQKVIIIRSTVPTREMGFLPGTLEEKEAVYETPYEDILADLFKRGSTYKDMKKAGILEFKSSSFIRGLTWDNCIIIIDEAQNMTIEELNSIMGRIGQNSKVIVLGDTLQNDLTKRSNDQSGFPIFLNVIKKMDCFEEIQFSKEDIVRSGFVKEWITAFEDYKK
jgi:predicted ribonuclease YlaK